MIYIILVLALVLRLINLNQSLWLDEAVQAITAQNSFAYIFQEIRGDFHPPLYYFLMHFWVKLFGSSEVVLRLPSVLFGVGTVYLVYRLGKLGGLGRLGLLGAAFLATAPFHIYYSQEARMYSMACFLASLSMYYFLKSNITDFQFKKIISKIKDQRSKTQFKTQNFNFNIILYFITTFGLIYTDYFAFLVLLAQMIYLLIKKKYKFLILNSLFIILCYIPWFPMLIIQLKTGMLATQNLPGWAKLVNISFLKALPITFVKFSIGRITIFDKRVYAFFGGFIIFLYGFLIAKGFLKGRKLPITNNQLLITLWFFVPLVVSWLASLFVPNYQPFRLLLILPSFYLILAEGIEGLEKNRRVKEVVVAVVLLVNFVSLSVYYLNPYFYREDWRGVVGFLKTQSAVAILPSETSNWPISYYDPQGDIKKIYGGTGVERVRGLRDLGGLGDLGNKIFYIRYLVSLFDPNEKILAELDVLGYTKVKEISFNQIPLWEFEMVTSD